MADAWLAGYTFGFTMDTGPLTSVACQTYSDTYGATIAPKPVFGADSQSGVATQRSGSFTAAGHASQEMIVELNDLATAIAEVAVTVTYWPSGATKTYQALIGPVTTDADSAPGGEVEFSITGEIVSLPVTTAAP